MSYGARRAEPRNHRQWFLTLDGQTSRLLRTMTSKDNCDSLEMRNTSMTRWSIGVAIFLAVYLAASLSTAADHNPLMPQPQQIQFECPAENGRPGSKDERR